MQSLTITRNRTVNVRASGSPFDRHRSKVRELISEIKNRREKYEKANTEFILKNQIILKQIFQDEIEYYKSICGIQPDDATKVEEVKPNNKTVEPDVIISESYDNDKQI